jgi:HPt (histidine-containing phosphotransfer) domain-containing protein
MSEALSVVFNKDFLPMTMGINDAALLAEIYHEYAASLRELMRMFAQDNPDSEKLFIEVHKLKSSSASVGAQYLAEKLAGMESTLLSDGDHLPLLTQLDMACRQTLDVVAAYAESLPKA